MRLQEIKKYLYSLRYFILFSFLVFIFAMVGGYIFAQNYPDQVKEIFGAFERVFEPLSKMTRIEQVLFIFSHNAISGFFAITFGFIFGVLPFLVLFANGEVFGIFLFLSQGTLPLLTFIVGILPHGIIEIPVLFFCGAIGMRIGKITINKIFKKEGEIKEEIKLGLNFFFKILLPLLFSAALIEVFITPQFLPEKKILLI